MVALEAALKAADAEAATFNARETLFGTPQTDYSRVRKLLEQFDPFLQFWLAAADLKRGQTAWMVTPLSAMDAEQARPPCARCEAARYDTIRYETKGFSSIRILCSCLFPFRLVSYRIASYCIYYRMHCIAPYRI